MSEQGFQGFFYNSDEQAQLDELKRKQAYAQALTQAGMGDPGSTKYAGLKNAVSSLLGAYLSKGIGKDEASLSTAAQDRYSQALASFLSGSTQPPQVGTVSPSTATPSAPQMPGQMQQTPQGQPQTLPNSPMPSMQGQPSMSAQPPMQTQPPMQAQPQAQGAPNYMQSLLATKNPQLMQQFGPALLQQQMSDESKKQTLLTANEIATLGLPKGTVVERDEYGGLNVVSKPDSMSPEAFAQKKKLAQIEQGPAWAALSKPIAVPFGATLVDPRSGRQLYTSGVDPAAIELGANYFIANGGKYPPNARSPMMQSQIAAAAQNKMDSAGLTMDDLVSKGIGIRARIASATQLGRLQAGTMVNEDTVRGSAQMLTQLIAKGAASPGPITGINQLQQWASRNTNNPDAVNLYNGINTYANEYARVMTGTTGGTPSSDSARNEAAKRLVTGYNGKTLQSAMDFMNREMAMRTGAQQQGLSQVTGGSYSGTHSIYGGTPSQQQPTQQRSQTLRYDANGNRIQ